MLDLVFYSDLVLAFVVFLISYILLSILWANWYDKPVGDEEGDVEKEKDKCFHDKTLTNSKLLLSVFVVAVSALGYKRIDVLKRFANNLTIYKSFPCEYVEDGIIQTVEPPFLKETMITLPVQGHFGAVTVYDSAQENCKYAVKAVDLKRKELQSYRRKCFREIYILNYLKGTEGVVQLKDAYLWREVLYARFEYLDGYSLKLYQKFPILREEFPQLDVTEEDVGAIAHQLVHILALIHSKNIIHRDLKPDNVMLTSQGKVNLIDFGLGTRPTTSDLVLHHGLIGNNWTMAPEMARAEPYDTKADVWAVGATLYLLLRPFRVDLSESNQAMITVENILWRQTVFSNLIINYNQIDYFEDEDLRDFLSKCLTVNPAYRPTSRKLLEHPFILKNADKESVIKKLAERSIHFTDKLKEEKAPKNN